MKKLIKNHQKVNKNLQLSLEITKFARKNQ
jgi:hypothetical protein